MIARLLRALFGRSSPTPPPQVATLTASVITSPSYDPAEERHPEYPLHVVGTSHYQDALRTIVESSDDPGPNWPYDGAQCEVNALLAPEDDNPYDSWPSASRSPAAKSDI